MVQQPKSRHLRLATGNAHKLREFSEILSPLGIEVRGLDDLASFHVVEDGKTFAQNAIKKVRALWEQTGGEVVADDSGIEVDALDGEPGVYSARYAPPHPHWDQDTANRRKLIERVQKLSSNERTARFVCEIAYCSPEGDVQTFRGTIEGEVIPEERGSGGFGYDPMFVPTGYSQTTAEMSAEEKHRISHRGNALRKLVEYLR